MFVYKGGEILGVGADIELLFGVKGGGSVAGASGKNIQQQLNNIIGNINKNPLGLKVTLNKNSTDLLKQSLLSELNSIEIKSFNSTEAINKLKADIQAALNDVSLNRIITPSGATDRSGTSPSMPLPTISEDTLKHMKTYNSRLASTTKKAESARLELEKLADALDGVTNHMGDGTQNQRNRSNPNSQSEITLQQIATLRRRAETLLRNNSKASNMGYGVVLRSAIEQLDGSTIDPSRFDSLRRSISAVELSLKEAGIQGKSFWSVLKAGYEKFGGWALITRSMTAAVSAVKQMVSNVTQLDAAMVELRKVTDESESTYEQFFDEATVRANKLGATVTDTINASADFARLGYSLEDAATLADTAIMYKNVGDGITDISVASQSIISTLKGFNLEASDATHVIDAFNEVGKQLCPAA